MKKRVFILNLFVIISLMLITALSAQVYTLKVTDEHPFYVINDEGVWKTADKLQVGDLLLTDDGNKAKITSIKEVYENIDVYNLHVDGLNDYFANEVLVHNKPNENIQFLGKARMSPNGEIPYIFEIPETVIRRLGLTTGDEVWIVIPEDVNQDIFIAKGPIAESKFRSLFGDDYFSSDAIKLKLKYGNYANYPTNYKAFYLEIPTDTGSPLRSDFNWNIGNYFYFYFKVDGVIIRIEPREVFSYDMPKKMQDLLTKKTGQPNPKVEFELSEPSKSLKELILSEYEKTLGKITESSSLTDLTKAVQLFDYAMKKNLPYLCEKDFQCAAYAKTQSILRKFIDYYSYIATKKPSLKQLGDCNMLSCSTQSATIRQSLGGKGSGWELYYNKMDNPGIMPYHVFVAKKFILGGKEYYVVIDPGSGESGFVMSVENFNNMPFERVNLLP